MYSMLSMNLQMYPRLCTTFSWAEVRDDQTMHQLGNACEASQKATNTKQINGLHSIRCSIVKGIYSNSAALEGLTRRDLQCRRYQETKKG
jgi:hypothetical protein